MKTFVLRIFYIFIFIFVFPLFLSGQSVFVNEINYVADGEVSATCKEGIGVAGPAGFSLDGWTLQIYDNNGLVIHSMSLDGFTIPNEDNNHGEVWFDVAQVSDGAAVALANFTLSYVQFLSYGASNLVVSATEGVASGMTSVYAGAQASACESLQLAGEGSDYQDFIWSLLPQQASAGLLNAMQTFNSVLPVELINFTASINNRGVLLQWSTAKIAEQETFVLERSTDAVNFKTIYELVVDENDIEHFSYQDNNPVEKTTNYYRLRQVELNGRATVSQIINIELGDIFTAFSLFPNPAVEQINISLPEATTADGQVQVLDMSGKVVDTYILQKGILTKSLSVNHLPYGQYIISIEVNDKVTIGRFVKK